MVAAEEKPGLRRPGGLVEETFPRKPGASTAIGIESSVAATWSIRLEHRCEGLDQRRHVLDIASKHGVRARGRLGIELLGV